MMSSKGLRIATKREKTINKCEREWKMIFVSKMNLNCSDFSIDWTHL